MGLYPAAFAFAHCIEAMHISTQLSLHDDKQDENRVKTSRLSLA